MAPTCSSCGADAIAVSVPPPLREFAPAETATATCCHQCLTVDPSESATPADEPPLSTISDALAIDAAGAAGVVLLVGMLDALALHRRDIQALIEHLEAEGVDALLVLEMLADDPTLRPAVDLDRRLHQLEQLLDGPE